MGQVEIELEVGGELDAHDSQMVTQTFSDDETQDNTQGQPASQAYNFKNYSFLIFVNLTLTIIYL